VGVEFSTDGFRPLIVNLVPVVFDSGFE